MLAEAQNRAAGFNEQREPRKPAVVGPNAIIQLLAALRAHCGASIESNVARSAGLERYRAWPPAELVDEREAARLFAATQALLGPRHAQTVLTTAGRLTADYILAHRMPGLAKAVLRRLPPQLGLRMLLMAIKAHAWTFAGSGVTTVRVLGRPAMLIAANPLATNGCPWHAAVLQRLCEVLISSSARVTYDRQGVVDGFLIKL